MEQKGYIHRTEVFKDGLGFVELLDVMGNDVSVVSSARVSHYNSGSKGEEGDRKLIHYLMKNRHTSPFECVTMTFRIKCPLFVRSQWHRHRTFSYNEVSRRYTSENIDEFFYPEKWRVQDTKNKQSSVDSDEINSPYWNAKVKEHVEKSLALYEDMLSNNISREQARMILPQNMYTMYYGTVNLRNLFHFLGLRMNPHAQEEIRVYAYAIADMIKDVVPISFDAWWEYEGQKIAHIR